MRALQAGADDFLTKPIDRAELLARVGSLVRIKRYHDTIGRQAMQLAEWNRTLERRVQEQVEELERLRRLRRFLSPQLAEVMISAEGETLLETHRRQIAVVACQLPGFRALAETTAPEEVVALIDEYHAAIAAVIFDFEGSLGPLIGDRVMVFFNDPLPVDDPAVQAVRMALAVRERMDELATGWARRGLAVDFGVGIDLGFATLGTIGFAGRREYGALGNVVEVAVALSDHARGSQVLVSQRVRAALPRDIDVVSLGELALPGFVRPIMTFEISGAGSVTMPITQQSALKASVEGDEYATLTEREREVVALIAQGLSNRAIAQQLVIAEATAVRHVANILGKLGFRSRAQVAVWAVQRQTAR